MVLIYADYGRLVRANSNLGNLVNEGLHIFLIAEAEKHLLRGLWRLLVDPYSFLLLNQHVSLGELTILDCH